MARAKECEICGARKDLKRSYGKMVCSYCQVVRAACKNRREVVVANLADLHLSDGEEKKEALAMVVIKRQIEILRRDMAALMRGHNE